MIYNDLSKYYDELVSDPSATLMWVEFVKEHIRGNKILEVACGSGEITNKLYENGFDILATDISNSMLEKLNSKYPNIKTKQLDMTGFNFNNNYDAVICFCDSINYLNSLDDCKSFFKSSFDSLNDDGTLIFDMHTEERLKEFEDEFIEEGFIDDTAYQWTINTDEDCIYHHFAFYEKDKTIEEYHTQKVFKLDDILNILYDIGFKCDVFIDFEKDLKFGEKYFIVGGKK